MPKKINTSVRKAKMEILKTVKNKKKSVLFKSAATGAQSEAGLQNF